MTNVQLLDNLRKWVRHLKGETFALCLAARHPETPRYAKLFVACVVPYVLTATSQSIKALAPIWK